MGYYKRIRELREDHDLTQRQLAAILHMTQTQYFRYEQGYRDIPTDILYVERDEMCERDTVEAFADRFGAGLTIVPGSEHYFHTPEQIAALRGWLERTWDT